MINFRIFVQVLFTIFIIGAFSSPSFAQTEIQNPADPYVHNMTGMQFPLKVGNFQRNKVHQYNADGSDMGFGYNLILNEKKVGYISIFVYPAPQVKASPDVEASQDAACKAHFDGISADISSRMTTAKLLKQEKVDAPSPIFKSRGYFAAFGGGTSNFAGETNVKVRDDSYLYCYAGGRWLVAYRLTWPEEYEVKSEFTELMKSLAWPETLASN